MEREKGWIKLHRKMLDNPIVCKDSDHIAVWMFLLLNATHRDLVRYFGKELITLKPGQLITGRKAIAKHFNLTESKVERILKRLKNEQLIEQRANTSGRLITIRNWEVYQNENEQQNEQRVNNERTTSEQRANTNKNIRIKEHKNNNDINNTRSHKFGEGSVEFEVAKKMINILLSIKPDAREPNAYTWANDIDKLIRLDKRTPEQIVWLFNWAQTNEFWTAYVRSPRKLREKWDTLQLQATRKIKKKTSDDDWRQKTLEALDELKSQ